MDCLDDETTCLVVTRVGLAIRQLERPLPDRLLDWTSTGPQRVLYLRCCSEHLAVYEEAGLDLTEAS